MRAKTAGVRFREGCRTRWMPAFYQLVAIIRAFRHLESLVDHTGMTEFPNVDTTETSVSLTYGKSTTLRSFSLDLFPSCISCRPCPFVLDAAIWQCFRVAIITSQWFIETLTHFKFAICVTDLSNHFPSEVNCIIALFLSFSLIVNFFYIYIYIYICIYSCLYNSHPTEELYMNKRQL